MLDQRDEGSCNMNFPLIEYNVLLLLGYESSRFGDLAHLLQQITMEIAVASVKSRVESSGPQHSMGCALQPFDRSEEDLHEVMAEQPVSFVASEFTVLPGS